MGGNPDITECLAEGVFDSPNASDEVHLSGVVCLHRQEVFEVFLHLAQPLYILRVTMSPREGVVEWKHDEHRDVLDRRQEFC